MSSVTQVLATEEHLFEQRFETQRRGERREEFKGIATNETTLRVHCDSAFISLPMLRQKGHAQQFDSLRISNGMLPNGKCMALTEPLKTWFCS
jgi:hypothetical protein